MTTKVYPGNAAPSALATPLSDGVDTTCDITTTTGWPTAGPWVARISKGVAGKEEKVLIGSRSGNGLTITTRGYDGTTGVAHDAGEPIECCWDADSATEVNGHVNNPGLDHHPQYMKADGTRHDLEARHQFGAALGTPSAPATPTATGSPSAGSGDDPAREDHVHDLPASLPRGFLGAPVKATASVPGIGTGGTDIVTHGAVTPGPGTRRLRITGSCEVKQSGSLSGMVVAIQEGSTVLTEHLTSIVTSGQTVTMQVEALVLATAAAHTYKMRVRSVGAASTSSVEASADSPAQISVEDVGNV